MLPLMVIYAKIIPKNLEATCFALLTGSSNISLDIAHAIGAAINKLYVGVTKTNLDNFWILQAISYGTCILPLFFLYYLPS